MSSPPRCPACRTSLVAIVFPAAEDYAADLVMHSCSACDRRWWHADGRHLDRDRALDHIAS